ncbi:hypothetical protein SAMN04488096_10450 [Mesonia phycicola]|uniref:Type IV leader peptidase family protein n=1 Tax=Mesonia phycicola TaxID=579105 RepID=A0A1M6DKS5_9FLAO|nr:hypothetical protein SAMN04488096_10450 [Mesonia phycicola]
MILIIDLIIIILLGIIVYQDFKYRLIHILVLLFIFIVGLLRNILNDISFFNFLRPALFISVILFFLWFYLIIKSKKIINPLDKHIGLGDILFFFSITPFFTLKDYIIYFISGLLFSIIFALFFKNYIEKKMIPLAGLLSIALIILIFLRNLFTYNLFNFY